MINETFTRIVCSMHLLHLIQCSRQRSVSVYVFELALTLHSHSLSHESVSKRPRAHTHTEATKSFHSEFLLFLSFCRIRLPLSVMVCVHAYGSSSVALFVCISLNVRLHIDRVLLYCFTQCRLLLCKEPKRFQLTLSPLCTHIVCRFGTHQQ